MNSKPTVAMLGSTGKAGAYILAELLNNNYPVKALIRKPETFTINHPLLQIVPGDIKDPETATKLIENCGVVVAAIGPRKDEPLISSLSTKNILAAMQLFHLKRFILLAGLNLDVPGDQKNEATQAATDLMRQNFPDAAADRQKAYESLAQSTTDWTILRLPWIEQTHERQGILIDTFDNPGKKISTTDLADLIILQIEDTAYIRKAPFVSSK